MRFLDFFRCHMGDGRGVDSQNILLDIFVIPTSVLTKCPEWFAFFVFYAVLPVTLCILKFRRHRGGGGGGGGRGLHRQGERGHKLPYFSRCH